MLLYVQTVASCTVCVYKTTCEQESKLKQQQHYNMCVEKEVPGIRKLDFESLHGMADDKKDMAQRQAIYYL